MKNKYMINKGVAFIVIGAIFVAALTWFFNTVNLKEHVFVINSTDMVIDKWNYKNSREIIADLKHINYQCIAFTDKGNIAYMDYGEDTSAYINVYNVKTSEIIKHKIDFTEEIAVYSKANRFSIRYISLNEEKGLVAIVNANNPKNDSYDLSIIVYDYNEKKILMNKKIISSINQTIISLNENCSGVIYYEYNQLINLRMISIADGKDTILKENIACRTISQNGDKIYYYSPNNGVLVVEDLVKGDTYQLDNEMIKKDGMFSRFSQDESELIITCIEQDGLISFGYTKPVVYKWDYKSGKLTKLIDSNKYPQGPYLLVYE